MQIALRWVLLGASALSYILCLPEKSFCVESDCNGWPGWGVLFMGWLEPLALPSVGPLVAFAWYANPLVVLAWLFGLACRRKEAIWCAAGATLLSSAFLCGNRVDTSEAGVAHEITGYAGGYWLWLASAWLALSSTLLIPARKAPDQ